MKKKLSCVLLIDDDAPTNFLNRLVLEESCCTERIHVAQSGQAVLMRLPSGRGWRLRASGVGIGLAESIYLGEEGRQRRTEQIVLVGQIPVEGAIVKWALTRMEG